NFTNDVKFSALLNGVRVEPLLMAANGFDKLSGTGNASITARTSGPHLAAMVNNLAGDGEIRLKDGKIKGIDLAQLARELKSAVNPAQDTAPRSTDFAELGGTFSIAKGILTNKD